MDPRLVAPVEFFKFNTHLFRKLTENLTDEQARKRIIPETHTIAFLACHLVEGRDCLANLVGIEKARSLADLVLSMTTVTEFGNQPPLAEARNAWNSLASVLESQFERLSREQLDRESRDRLPGNDPSTLGAIIFLLHHESYHIGQIALIRKHLLGLGANYGHRVLLSEGL